MDDTTNSGTETDGWRRKPARDGLGGRRWIAWTAATASAAGFLRAAFCSADCGEITTMVTAAAVYTCGAGAAAAAFTPLWRKLEQETEENAVDAGLRNFQIGTWTAGFYAIILMQAEFAGRGATAWPAGTIEAAAAALAVFTAGAAVLARLLEATGAVNTGD